MCLTYQICQSLSYFLLEALSFYFFNSRENILYISINFLLFEIYSYLYQVFTEQPKSCHRHGYKQVQVIIWHDLTFDWFLRIIFYHSFALTSSTGPYFCSLHAQNLSAQRYPLWELWNINLFCNCLSPYPDLLFFSFYHWLFIYVLFLPPFHNVKFTKENISLLCLFQHKL